MATVNDSGIVKVLAVGNSEITATLAGKEVKGKLIIKHKVICLRLQYHLSRKVMSNLFLVKPIPMKLKVILHLVFGGSTTKTSILTESSGKVLQYADNNYTGIIFNNAVNASTLGFLHVDVYVKDASATIGIQIRDIGANKALEKQMYLLDFLRAMIKIIALT